jgi:hypothetical protein
VIKRHTVARLADLTPELLSDVLDAPVAEVTITPLSTGNMSASSRLHLRYADGATGPASLVAKMPVDTPEARMVSAYTDRTEIGFYTQIAPRVSIPSPTCYNAGLSQEHGALILLEDITPAVTVDQIDGCTAEQARLAVTNVAGLHTSTWNDVEFRDIDFRSPIGPHVVEGMQAMMDAGGPAFIERYGTPADQTEVIRAFTAATTRWFQRRLEPFALLHTDYRLDNLLFAPDPTSERAVVTVDWTRSAPGSRPRTSRTSSRPVWSPSCDATTSASSCRRTPRRSPHMVSTTTPCGTTTCTDCSTPFSSRSPAPPRRSRASGATRCSGR